MNPSAQAGCKDTGAYGVEIVQGLPNDFDALIEIGFFNN
jgi:hypothetical protein